MSTATRFVVTIIITVVIMAQVDERANQNEF